MGFDAREKAMRMLAERPERELYEGATASGKHGSGLFYVTYSEGGSPTLTRSDIEALLGQGKIKEKYAGCYVSSWRSTEMTPFERSRKALKGIDMRRVLEHSGLPVEIATALADLCEERPPESEALALLRELNDALVIPGWLQPRVDALLDRAEPREPSPTCSSRTGVCLSPRACVYEGKCRQDKTQPQQGSE